MDYLLTAPLTSMQNAFSVKGKNVVVTGGGSGIGRGIAKAFAESGANVIIFDINLTAAQAVCEELKSFGGRHTCFACNIADHENVKTACAGVFEFFDHVDVLVNNAGVGTTQPFLSDKGLDEWHRVININLHGTAHMIYEIAPKMVEAGKGGEIINISSCGAVFVGHSKTHHNAPYNVSKAGVDIFTKYLAICLGDEGIRVNSIRPGPIHSALDKDLPPEVLEEITDGLPCHRFGEPLEIGALCVYLSSPAGVQITGVHYNLDGGLLAVQ